MNPWLLLQTRELKGAFSQGSHTHRFSAFWLRSSVRLSQLHLKNRHRPLHRACTGPSTSAHVFPVPPDEIHSCRTRTYVLLAPSPDSSEWYKLPVWLGRSETFSRLQDKKVLEPQTVFLKFKVRHYRQKIVLLWRRIGNFGTIQVD